MIKKITTEKSVGFLTLKEMMNELETRPDEKYLWAGINDKSFGLIFGPPKSGKTIFCENLAMNIAMGKKEFFGYKLDGIPKKVLFVGLEEFWVERGRRNKKQFDSLSEENQALVESNYIYQAKDFARNIITDEDFNNLEKMIIESKAEVVFIDSITRMNHGKIENSDTAEKIMQTLRNICYDNDITLICIHHTPKMKDEMITMDKIKGSGVFAQEADFAIGVNCSTRKNRYIKEVFYRYASDDIDTVKEFEIGDDIWLNYFADVDEEEIIARTDRRRNTESKEVIEAYFDKNPNSTYSTGELVNFLKMELTIKERQIKAHLKDLVQEGRIVSPERGVYGATKIHQNNG